MLKKILIAFFLAFFPVVFCAIDNDFFVYADNTMIFEEYADVPIVNEANLYATYTDSYLWGRINSNNYYYAMWYVDVPDTNKDYFVIIAYQNETVATPQESQAKTSIDYTINSVSAYIQGQIWKYSGSSWGTNTFLSVFTNPNQTSLFVSGSDNVNYFCGGNVDCEFNGEPVDPEPEVQGDTFICNKDGYSINFGVFCGPASNNGILDTGSIPFYYSNEYTVSLEFTVGNDNIVLTIPSYLYWSAKADLYIEGDDSEGILTYLPLFSPYADVQYSHSMRAIRCYQSSSPSAIWVDDFNSMSDYRSFNTVTLNQILQEALNNYPDLVISDLYTEIDVKFYQQIGISSVLKQTYTLDWSSTSSNYVPPEDKGDEPNPFDTITNLNNTMISNNRYLKDMLYGEQYIKHGWGEKISQVDFDGLNTIPTPNYTFTEETLDTDALGFFGWLVEFWYSSPFGIIALVSLTFLVIRTIIW